MKNNTYFEELERIGNESLPDSVSEFRTDYWGHLLEKVTVHRKGTMTFSFACGVEIQI